MEPAVFEKLEETYKSKHFDWNRFRPPGAKKPKPDLSTIITSEDTADFETWVEALLEEIAKDQDKVTGYALHSKFIHSLGISKTELKPTNALVLYTLAGKGSWTPAVQQAILAAFLKKFLKDSPANSVVDNILGLLDKANKDLNWVDCLDFHYSNNPEHTAPMMLRMIKEGFCCKYNYLCQIIRTLPSNYNEIRENLNATYPKWIQHPLYWQAIINSGNVEMMKLCVADLPKRKFPSRVTKFLNTPSNNLFADIIKNAPKETFNLFIGVAKKPTSLVTSKILTDLFTSTYSGYTVSDLADNFHTFCMWAVNSKTQLVPTKSRYGLFSPLALLSVASSPGHYFQSLVAAGYYVGVKDKSKNPLEEILEIYDYAHAYNADKPSNDYGRLTEPNYDAALLLAQAGHSIQVKLASGTSFFTFLPTLVMEKLIQCELTRLQKEELSTATLEAQMETSVVLA